jgi:4-hydroxythreonine-4-phosphate dehydrogenase
MGDAAGIGPEIALKALASMVDDPGIEPLVIGDLGLLKDLNEALGLGLVLAAGDDLKDAAPAVSVFDLGNLHGDVVPGTESAECGRAAGEYIEAAVELWRQGNIDAIATAPISKRTLGMGGYNFPGHTEFIASLTDTAEFAMSFFGGPLRVVLLSTHVSLIDAIALVKRAPLEKLIRFTAEQMAALLGRQVKLAVAGLNPHASENGMFGGEEAAEISPAVDECRDKWGIDVSGPYSPDTIFLRAHRGEFDAVIACYHDQATIAVKSLAFGSAVNVTLGLPLIRTSVDHGTAFDIAGTGKADPSSMEAAIRLAGELAGLRAAAK